MRFIKITASYALFILCLPVPAFSSGDIHIAVLDEPFEIEATPFARRVQVFPQTEMQVDEENEGHGAAVCSVLVGKNSSLPEDTLITFLTTLSHFSAFLETTDPDDLIILNWSGTSGYPGMPANVQEELQGLYNHFATILEMREDEFESQVDDYINAYNSFLVKLPDGEDALSLILKYAKSRLLELQSTPSEVEAKREEYKEALSKKIEEFKDYGIEQAKLHFEEMKDALRSFLQQHENTLLVRPMGNEGVCIDEDAHWKDLLSDDLIISHTILVQGTDIFDQRHKSSNYTETYTGHVLGKPYAVPVWNCEDQDYFLEQGTSFSTPLVTVDAFHMAERIRTETGGVPSYADVKLKLLEE